MLTASPNADLAANLRRLMARQGVSLDQLAAASAVDRRTIASVLRGKKQPHSRTLRRLADALLVPADEFFQDPSLLTHRTFDRQTNPLVDKVIAEQPHLFAGWSESDFDELYSHFGTGGALTREGATMAAQRMNRARAVQEKVALVLETHEAELLEEFVDLLYRRVTVVPPQPSGHVLPPTTKRTNRADLSQNSPQSLMEAET
jgi:transcriptional regulator with XRE-family HTH domain